MWLIFKKEFKELLRDKKTIIFMIGLPLLLFPAIFGVAFFFMSSAADKAENKVLKYAIVGEAYAPAIVQSFNDASDKFESVAIGDETDYAKLIKNETLDFVLLFLKPLIVTFCVQVSIKLSFISTMLVLIR